MVLRTHQTVQTYEWRSVTQVDLFIYSESCCELRCTRAAEALAAATNLLSLSHAHDNLLSTFSCACTAVHGHHTSCPLRARPPQGGRRPQHFQLQHALDALVSHSHVPVYFWKNNNHAVPPS